MLKQKSVFNFDAGNLLLHEKNNYAPSIHCFYYSCLQLIKYSIHDNDGISYDRLEADMRAAIAITGQNSHMYLINSIGREIKRYNDDEFVSFNRKINQLRLLRNKSDYQDVTISPDDSLKAYEMALDIRNQLINIFHV